MHEKEPQEPPEHTSEHVKFPGGMHTVAILSSADGVLYKHMLYSYVRKGYT